MAQARLLVDLPEGPWIGDVSRQFPDAQFNVLTAMPGDGAGFALVEIVSAHVGDVLDAMREHESLLDTSVMARDAEIATVQIETTGPLLLIAAQRSGVPIEMPVVIENGTARIDVTGDHERVATFGDQLRQIGLSFDVEYVQQRVNPGQSLTERQREILFAAVDLGYYDVPRRCTLTELADHFGIAKSTCSETLQRVERTIVREFVDDLPSRPIDPDSPASNP